MSHLNSYQPCPSLKRHPCFRCPTWSAFFVCLFFVLPWSLHSWKPDEVVDGMSRDIFLMTRGNHNHLDAWTQFRSPSLSGRVAWALGIDGNYSPGLTRMQVTQLSSPEHLRHPCIWQFVFHILCSSRIICQPTHARCPLFLFSKIFQKYFPPFLKEIDLWNTNPWASLQTCKFSSTVKLLAKEFEWRHFVWVERYLQEP